MNRNFINQLPRLRKELAEVQGADARVEAGRCCGGCMFFTQERLEPESVFEAYGACRRYPAPPEPTQYSKFPPTTYWEICGEFMAGEPITSATPDEERNATVKPETGT